MEGNHIFILLGNETLCRRFDLCSSGQRASRGLCNVKLSREEEGGKKRRVGGGCGEGSEWTAALSGETKGMAALSDGAVG